MKVLPLAYRWAGRSLTWAGADVCPSGLVWGLWGTVSGRMAGRVLWWMG